MPNNQNRTDPLTEAVGVYLALLDLGVPTDHAMPRSMWDMALRAAATKEGSGTSTRSLRERTSAARDHGLIDVQFGAGNKNGLVKLKEPGNPHQFIPDLDPTNWLDLDSKPSEPTQHEHNGSLR